MKIWINRAGQNLGTFSLEEVQNGLNQGQFVATDLCWQEGMESWIPLSQFPGVQIPPPSVPVSGVMPPPPEPVRSEITPTGTTSDTGTAPAWEEPGNLGAAKAFLITFRQVLFEPVKTFERLPTAENIGRAFGFCLLATLVSYAILALFILLIGVVFGVALFSAPQQDNSSLGLGLGMGVGVFIIEAVVIVIAGPIIHSIASFVLAGIFHLMLLMLGGASRGFATSYRVVAYSSAANILTAIPYVGTLGGVWACVIMGIGLCKAHRTQPWKAVVAVLTPIILLCACFVALFAFVFVAAQQSGKYH